MNRGATWRFGKDPTWTLVVGLAALLGFGFLGSRGLWEPDEGRYVQVAREMTITGNYITPKLNQVPHFTKPPLTYWMTAAGLRLIGMNEWGARVGNGLAFAATALLVALLGEHLAGSARGRWAGVIYMTMLVPFVAASLITPDTLLTLGHTSALFCFWKGWTASAPCWARRWMLGFWAALGVGFMAKGPPVLLAVAIVLACVLSGPPPACGLGRAVWLRPSGLIVFLVLVLPWFLLVAARHPGLGAYLLHDEVLGRITGSHHRHNRWFMGFVIYPATVVLGTLPWSLTWISTGRRFPGGNPWRWARADPGRFFLAAWVAIPLVVFAAVPSRLPLYVLPIFPAIALAVCRMAPRDDGPDGSAFVSHGAPAPLLAAWIAVLLGLRIVTAWYPAPQDTRALARWIGTHVGPIQTEVVVVDDHIYGLPFYLDVPVEMASPRPERFGGYRPTTGAPGRGDLRDRGGVVPTPVPGSCSRAPGAEATVRAEGRVMRRGDRMARLSVAHLRSVLARRSTRSSPGPSSRVFAAWPSGRYTSRWESVRRPRPPLPGRGERPQPIHNNNGGAHGEDRSEVIRREGGDTFMPRVLLLAVLLPLVAGCAGSTAPPRASAAASRDAQYCERYGGIWHGNLGVCEADMMP